MTFVMWIVVQASLHGGVPYRHFPYWSVHTKDESKCILALSRCGVTASFGVFFHEIKCNGMTSFMEFMLRELLNSPSENMASPCFLAGKLATHTTTITIVLVYE